MGSRSYADRPVVQLSGGQMQRVALARSLVYEPQLLLLDEPLSNLDAKLRLRLRDDLRRIIKQTGVTALYVTHDQAEAVVLGDRIGVMRDGKLLQMASADELYNRPADLFVANFTGCLEPARTAASLQRNGEFGMVEAGSGQQLSAWLPASVEGGRAGQDRGAAGERAARRQRGGGAQHVHAHASPATRYQGTQTVYELDVLGGRIDALELGTQVRYPVGSDVKVVLPPDLCWAYPAGETTDSE